MNSDVFYYVYHQLLYQLPVFLLSIIGLVLSFFYISRSRWPAILTLSAMLILLLTTVVFTIIQAFVFSSRTSGAYSLETYGQFQMVTNVLAALFHAVAIGLLLIAVFSGRKRAVTDPVEKS